MKKSNEKQEETCKENDNNEVVSEELEEKELDEIAELEAEIDKLKLALEHENTKFLKAHADLENTKKRLTNEFNLKDKYKIQSFALSILPAIDNMEKVLSENNEENNTLKEAIEMIYRQLLNSLEEEGIKEIDALDKPFDPNIHHAVMVEEVEGTPADIVLEVLLKGYMLKDRVLRASMVKVSQ